MGYYTNFELSRSGGYIADDELADVLSEETGYGWGSDLTAYSIKWYDWEEDMKTVSQRFPDVLFELEGDGEEQGDHWKAYFKNGKVQITKAKVTFEPYDEGKMK